ncbi:XRE family transcriptional regulator [Actinopolyspora mortivallis]|uniref:XRE family transcriptional regulator n=1 Tax=Actinopolyspora mortivallis TaxID=33906 RepID=A0A2T0GRZ4_ACTMO|nr:XRE family transcriptional regulator [Actinopolyspora mortivallis]
MNGRDFSYALGEGWTQSKVSKLETGRQTATDSDVVDWLHACGASEPVVQRVLDELRELRVEEVTWRRQLRGGHQGRQSQIARLEQHATRIRGLSTALVPGLVQTANYARAVFTTQSDLHGTERDPDEAVRERLRRQEVLYEPDKRIDILITESALLHSVVPPADMIAQLDRLNTILALPNLRMGILPAGRTLPHTPIHGFWILDDHVLVENITAELRITDPDQIGVYETLADQLWSAADVGNDASAILQRLTELYRDKIED